MPVKKFEAFEILTAADVNANLMNQSVMTFSDAAARDAAFTAADVTATSGMTCYLSSTASIYTYNGTTWIPESSLTPIIPSVTFTSGTAPTVSTSGKVTANANSVINLTNCFSSTFDNYKIFIKLNGSASQLISFNLHTGSAIVNAANYGRTMVYATASTPLASAVATQTSWQPTVASGNFTRRAFEVTLFEPFVATATTGVFSEMESDGTSLAFASGGLQHTLATSYPGFSVTASAGTFTGSIQVFGVNNA
jgi:hypothetical protein